MAAMKTFFSIGLYRRLPMLVGLGLVSGLFLQLSAPSVSAVGARFAVIEEVKGNAYVQKAGGSREFKAFRKMPLNQGDHLRTEKQASVILKVLDREDEITIGENSSIYISDLKQSSGKKTRFKIWAGSIWVKAKSLANSNDEFEVETPTAVMGVRGTQFFTGVDLLTGDTKVIVGAGVVSVELQNNNSLSNSGTDNWPTNHQVLIWPLYEAEIFHQPESGNRNTPPMVAPIDVDAFARSSSQAIIEAILRNKADLDRENAEFVERQKLLLAEGKLSDPGKRLFDISGPADSGKLNILSENLDNLVGSIVASAINQQRVDADKIKRLINEVDHTGNKKLDLDKVVPLKLSAKQAKLFEQLKRIKEQRRKQLEEQKRLKEKKRKQYEELLTKLKEQQVLIAKQNEKALEDAQNKAEEAYLNQLSENEKQRFENDKFNRQQNNTAGPKTGSTNAGGNSGSSAGACGRPDGLSIEPEPVSVTMAADQNLLDMNPLNHFNVNVSLGDVKNCYGAEIHLVFNQGIVFSGHSEYLNKLFPETAGEGHALVSLEDVRQISGTDGISTELIYSIVKIGDTYRDSYNSSSGMFVSIPFDRHLALDGNIQLSYLKLVDQNGDSIYEFRADATHPGPSLEYRYP